MSRKYKLPGNGEHITEVPTDDYIINAFSQRLDKHITDNDLSASAIAKRSEISTGIISTYRGMSDETKKAEKVQPSLVKAAKIAQALGISLDYLAGLTGDKKQKPTATDELGLSFKAVSQLSSRQHQLFIEIINAILESPIFYDFVASIGGALDAVNTMKSFSPDFTEIVQIEKISDEDLSKIVDRSIACTVGSPTLEIEPDGNVKMDIVDLCRARLEGVRQEYEQLIHALVNFESAESLYKENCRIAGEKAFVAAKKKMSEKEVD